MTAGGNAAGVVSFLVGRAGDGSTVRWSTPTADVFGDAKYTADETTPRPRSPRSCTMRRRDIGLPRVRGPATARPGGTLVTPWCSRRIG
jgi:hypothetical protein